MELFITSLSPVTHFLQVLNISLSVFFLKHHQIPRIYRSLRVVALTLCLHAPTDLPEDFCHFSWSLEVNDGTAL